MKKCIPIVFALVFAAAILFLTSCSIFTGNGEKPDVRYSLSDELIGYRLTSDPDPVYDGTPKTRSFVITYNGERIDTVISGEEHPDLNVEYRDNVNAGTASILVAAKSASEKYTGSMTVNFPILPDPAPISAGDAASLNDILSSGNYLAVQFSADIAVAAGQSVTIPADVNVQTNGFSLYNLGEVRNEGTLRFTSEQDERAVSENGGSFVNLGSVYFADDAALLNDGTFENEGKVFVDEWDAGVYSSTDLIGSPFEGFYRRYALEECDVSLSSASAVYEGIPVTPSVVVRMGETTFSANDCNIVYENNIDVGTATVTVTALPFSKSLIGERILTFTIEQAECVVRDERALLDAVGNLNYGKIFCYATMLSADLLLPDGQELVLCGSTVKSSGDWTIDGTLSVEEDTTWTHSGDLKIGGSVSTAGTTYFTGTVTNSGTLFSGAQIYNRAYMKNRGTLETAGAFYNEGTLVNQGTAVNGGKFYQFPQGSLSSDTPFDNAGTAYLDEENSAFADGYVIRERIGADNTSLDRYEFTYDGSEQKPRVVFGDGSVRVPHSVLYSYSPDGIREEAPVRAGTVYLTVSVSGKSEQYCGTYTLTYRILRASATFTDREELEAILYSVNHDTAIASGEIVLDEDVTVETGKSLIVPEGADLINAASLTVLGNAEISGRYCEREGAKTNVADGASFRVDGETYFNGASPAGVSGEGKIFVRIPLSEAATVGFPESVIYSADGTPRPKVDLRTEEIELISHDEYRTSYVNADDATLTDAPAVAVSTAYDFSPHCYGSRRDNYQILPAEISVSTFEQLLDAVNSHREDADFGNYSLITLTQHITHYNQTLDHITLRVAENTTLMLGNYSLNLYDGGAPYNKTHYIVNNGTMVFGYKTTLLIDLRYSGTGLIECETDNAQVAEDMASLAHVIRLTGDIEEELVVIPYRSKNFTLDLNGYSVRKLSVALGDDLNLPSPDLFKIISSRAGGTLGAEGSAEEGLYVAVIDEGKQVLVSGIEIFGIEYYKNTDPTRITIVNCEVHSL